MSDPVNNPDHYNKGGIECIEAIEEMLGENFKYYCLGNVLKYIWRHEYKNGIEDLEKASWYMLRCIQNITGCPYGQIDCEPPCTCGLPKRFQDLVVKTPTPEEVDLDICPGCGGPADNGHDRCIPPSPYLCTKCCSDVVVKTPTPPPEENPGEPMFFNLKDPQFGYMCAFCGDGYEVQEDAEACYVRCNSKQ